MTDDTITGRDALEKAVDESTAPDLSMSVSVEIDEFDLESGILTVTKEIGGESYQDEWYLPDRLDWHPPDTKVTAVPFEVTSEVGDLLEEAVADVEGVDPEHVSVKAIKAVNTVEWHDSSDWITPDAKVDETGDGE